MSAVKKEFERRLREARIRPVDNNRPGTIPPAQPTPGSDTQLVAELGAGPAGTSPAVTPRTPHPTVLDPDAPATEGRRRQPPKPAVASIKRRRSVQNVNTAPEIVWLDTESQVADEELTDRAAKYDTATNTLYLNGLYAAVQGKIERLENQYAQQVTGPRLPTSSPTGCAPPWRCMSAASSSTRSPNRDARHGPIPTGRRR